MTPIRRLSRRPCLGAVLALPILIAAVGCGSAQVGTGPDVSARERDVEITHESCDSSSSSARRVDANGDGKPDIINVMSGGREVCRVVDLNLDGEVDAFIYYDGAGQERRRESDFDRDGRPDEIATLQGGVLVAKERETNFDGKLDTWDTYAGGRLTKRERDSDGDKIVDQWWEFTGDDPKCAVVASDKNADGKPDLETKVDLCADPNAPFTPPSTASPPAASGSAPAGSAVPASSAPAPGAPAASAVPAPGAPKPPASSPSAAPPSPSAPPAAPKK